MKDVIKITFDCNRTIDDRVIQVKKNEKCSKNKVFNELLKFALDCYDLMLNHNINPNDAIMIFKKGVFKHVNYERGNNSQ